MAIALIVGFYVLAVAVIGVLLFLGYEAAANLRAAGVKVLIAAWGTAGAIALSLRPRRDVFEPPGPVLTRRDQPELFAAIDGIAKATGQTMPDVVYASPDMNAAVANRGGFFGFGGQRVMILGLPLLHSVTVDQLRAILAHEFGHYGAGDTRIGRIVYRAHVGLGRTLDATQGKAIAKVFDLYGRMVLNITSSVSREQELEADRFAARATSTADMIAGLETTNRLGLAFLQYMGVNVKDMLEKGVRPPICTGFVQFIAHETVQQQAESLQTFFSQFQSAYDTHPPLNERVASLNTSPCASGSPADSRLASALLAGADQLEIETFTTEDGTSIRSLRPGAWSEYLPLVRQPYWRERIRENQSVLAELELDALPESSADRIALGRRLADPQAKLMEEAELDVRILTALHSAVCLRLLAFGWTPTEEPVDRLQFRHGDLLADQLRLLNRYDDDAKSGGWKEFCAKAGLNGKLLPDDLISSLVPPRPPRASDHLLKAFRESRD